MLTVKSVNEEEWGFTKFNSVFVALEEMVHFLATDAHDMMGRAPEMANAVSYVSKHFGEDYCNRIVADNPVRVINNEYIDP